MAEEKLRMMVTEDIPEMGLQRGDLIRWDLGASEHPFVLLRRRSFDYGALLVGLNEGRIEPIAVTPGASASSERERAEVAADQALRPQLRGLRLLG